MEPARKNYISLTFKRTRQLNAPSWLLPAGLKLSAPPDRITLLATDLQQLLSSALSHLADESAERKRLGHESFLQRYLAGRALAGPRSRVRALVHLLSRAYGDDEATLRDKLGRLGALCRLFLELYGDGPVELLRAPARINILGEHVDYVSYLPTASLPFGSREHDMIMLYRAAETGRVRGASAAGAYAPFGFDLGDGPDPGGQNYVGHWLSYLYRAPAPAPHWGNYVKGAAYFARVKYGRGVTRGYDFVVDSGIPPSGGASSSSALVVLAGAAVRRANRVEADAAELALDSSQAEWYVGTRGGSMDHLTICLAKRSHAVGISYAEQPQTRLLPLPGERLRWVTFFSHPADKGREIMLEYNERAAVSRLLIPALIEGWRSTAPRRHAAWERAVEAIRSGSRGALAEAESLLLELPEAITLAQVEQTYPEAYRECARAFPALAAGRRERPLRVRAYALHHLGEVRRVSAAESLLGGRAAAGERQESGRAQAAASVGALINESHASLRDLYGVSTPDVEGLIDTIRSDPRVYGARLMGGGFGGNVLALTDEDNLAALVGRVQASFYGPRGRDARREGSLMVSTPGDGLSRLSPETVWREAVEQFNALGSKAADHKTRLAEMLDEVTADAGPGEVWPVVVAAGKGSRARESGLDVPKPLAAVAGVPAVLRVVQSIRAAAVTRPPVVIVSPETAPYVREALSGEDVTFVTQPEARGTGDAVLHAQDVMKECAGRALVVWGTQPVLRPRTIGRALKLAALFAEYEMVLPTALKEQPYAPLERDGGGRVLAARETHLEKAPRPDFGETNVGLFVLDCRKMFEALLELRGRYWREAERRYDRPGGELGFPNELINYFAARPTGVLACPFADGREGQGIKTLGDVARCERFLAELQAEEAS